MILPMLWTPDGLLKLTVTSGTPETLAVKAMDPLANAANGLPEGASVTESVSMTSAYSSFEVWRTLARRHGRAGVLVMGSAGVGAFEKLDDNGDFLEKPILLDQT